jgi:predicted N-formylglutamate amidohydrolase
MAGVYTSSAMLEADLSSTPGLQAERRESTGADALRAVEVYHGQGQAPVLLLCDHAGRQIPARLGTLGLAEAELDRHIAYDVGAAEVTRALARLLDAPAVLCHISRLVIDPNRLPGDPSSIPSISDGTSIPGNHDVDAEERKRRLRLSFVPYHRAVARAVAKLRRRVGVPVIVSIHSFTAILNRMWRPWQVAVLWDKDPRLAQLVLAGLRRDPTLAVGDNEPYSGRYPVPYSIPFHAERRRLPHVTLELRQDLIEAPEGVGAWAARLAEALRGPLADPLTRRRLGL